MLSLIVAFDEGRVIGLENKLPWSIPEEMKKFRELTTGNVVIMGRETFESIGKPLPDRVNIVLTRDKGFSREGIYVFDSINKAVDKAREFQKEIFFIGGESIYRQILPMVEKMYISHIHGSYRGDSFFPENDFKDFELLEEEVYPEFIYREYKRKS